MEKKVLIGFDFSINKPAATILMDGKFHFLIWPTKLTAKEEEIYGRAGVRFRNRRLEPVGKKSGLTTSRMVLEHTVRSIDLADMIVDDIIEVIGGIEGKEIYVASEGLSFSSKGNSSLDLAGYKSVMLERVYQRLTRGRIFTYAPITIKKVAGLSKKGEFAVKDPVIAKFKEEPLSDCALQRMIRDGETIAKSNHIHCIDDIVDSYFCCKTMYSKEGMDFLPIWND